MSACGSGLHYAGKTGRDGERSKGAREKTEMCEEAIVTDTEAMTGVRPRPGLKTNSLGPTNVPQVPVHTSVGGGEAQTSKMEAVASAESS